jgi:hypothetical protein
MLTLSTPYSVHAVEATRSPVLPGATTSTPPTSSATSAPRAVPTAPTGTSALTRDQQARITNLAANISTRLELTIDRLRQIGDRLEARRAIIATSGVDTGAAAELLATASSTLSQARNRLSGIDQRVIGFVSAPTAAAEWSLLRGIYEATERDIVAAHTALTTALEQLQNPAATPQATSTNSVTP